MAHEDSHDDHGHDMTEGKRQYYPKGWYLPLTGLVIVAFCFSLGAGALLGISGTDKWGKKDACCEMENCKEGDMNGKCDPKTCDPKDCKDKEGNMMMDHKNNDSVNASMNATPEAATPDTAKK